MSPLVLSLLIASLSVLLGLPPAIALGWVLARKPFVGKTLVSALVLGPLVLPPVVTGLLLLRLFGRRGALGPLLEGIGVSVPFTTLGALVAALVVGLPLYVIAARTAFEGVDPRLEEVAATLGETPRSVFRRITLPLAWPGLLAGAVLAFARALGEFGATAVLAGDVPGQTRTIALAVYAALQSPNGEPDALRLSLLSVGLSVLALIAHELLAARTQRHRA